MLIPIHTVDAFTDKPFSGNPAGVCILEKELNDKQMQNIAFKMNLSETAFIVRSGKDFLLRWFTPVAEINLCGHATLASAHLLREQGIVKVEDIIHFHTKSGLLTARFKDEEIELNFPAMDTEEISIFPDLEKAIGTKPVYTGKSKWIYIAELKNAEEIRSLKPDIETMRTLPFSGEVLVTAKADMPGYDFISRFFAPSMGVNEDPVTGSAHCVLGPYWMKKLNKNIFKAYQASKRGGTLGVRVQGDRVYLTGKAVTVLTVEMTA
ncbi:MAG: PhzF family phenazine biosynthesis protein [Ignavibacteria bacterium]|jgi:PhzF family phenazine biosynthesis protein